MSLIWSLLQYLVFGLVQDEPAGLPWLEQRPLLVKDTFIAPTHTYTHSHTHTHTHSHTHTHTHTLTYTHTYTHTHTLIQRGSDRVRDRERREEREPKTNGAWGMSYSLSQE